MELIREFLPLKNKNHCNWPYTKLKIMNYYRPIQWIQIGYIGSKDRILFCMQDSWLRLLKLKLCVKNPGDAIQGKKSTLKEIELTPACRLFCTKRVMRLSRKTKTR